LALAGANHVIMPDKIGGDYMAALLTVPDLIHFLGTLDWWQEDTSPNVEELKLSLIPKNYQQKSLAQMGLRKHTGCNVIGYRDGNGKQYINPDANLVLDVEGETDCFGDSGGHKKIKQNVSLRLVCFSFPFLDIGASNRYKNQNAFTSSKKIFINRTTFFN